MNQPVAQKVPMNQIYLDVTLDRSHFDAEKMAELAASMKEHGLINPISVRLVKGEGGKEKGETTPLTPPPSPLGVHYEVMVGNRRFKAAQSLGWTEIDARVYPTETSETESELLALVDNLQRDDLNPIDQARSFFRLTRPPHELSQRDIAESVGKSQTSIFQSLSLLGLPAKVQKLISQLIISPSHAQILLKLRMDSTKEHFANLAAQKGWSVKQLEQEIANWSKKGTHELPAAASEAPLEDPLKKFWEEIALKRPGGAQLMWQVNYAKNAKANLPAWTFEVIPMGASARETLGRWFQAMGESFGKVASEAQEIRQAQAAIDQLAPRESAPSKTLENEIRGLRVPKTPAEEAELLALASQGPAAVYAWIYGPSSLLAQQAQGKTWQSFGVSDPSAAIKDIIEGLKAIP